MKFGKLLAAMLAFVLTGIVAVGQSSPSTSAPTSGSATSTPTSEATSTPAKPLSAKEQAQKDADDACDKLIALYMKDDWINFKAELPNVAKVSRNMSKEKLADFTYISKAFQLHYPAWWVNCKSASPVSFKITLWGKDFTANYEPDFNEVGVQIPVDIDRGRVRTKVSWDPNYVDNHDVLDEAKRHWVSNYPCTKAEFAEGVAWHELGHSYITGALPADQIITLYQEHWPLFSSCQEFYADVTALYHAGPRAHMVLIKLRLSDLLNYDDQMEKECHARGCSYGVGSLLMSKIITEPEKWPSFHFPPTLPDKNPEVAMIAYMYKTLKGMTLTEDRAMREYLLDFISKKGDNVLRSKGDVLLPNGLKYNVLAVTDRENKAARDKWVVDQHKKLVSTARVDKEAPKDEIEVKTKRGKTIIIIKQED